jgi:hypothetical protein
VTKLHVDVMKQLALIPHIVHLANCPNHSCLNLKAQPL